MHKIAHLFATICLLSGCAATPYQAASNFGGFDQGGYSDSRLNGNTAVVRFRGNERTSFTTANQYMLYRCAQVTISNGYDYFVVTSTTASPVNVHVNTVSTYGNYQSYPPRAHNSYYQKTRIASVDTTPSQTQENTANMHGSVAVIKMFNGRPAGIPNAFNARDVIAHYGPSTF